MSAGGESHREIERKFLVRQLPENLAAYPHVAIAQGYLAIAPRGVQVRLRKAGAQHSLAFKRNLAIGREEREVELTAVQFTTLWPATKGKRLTKTRYHIPLEHHLVEIDVYSGRHEGLVVAEVEFRDEQSAGEFQPPDWLGDDVSHDPRYSNQLLAS
ncbi:CYTH domain-containing protein [soil metagenome]|nr:CYTH domain-containing protein [Chthoniobacterales bacterium]